MKRIEQPHFEETNLSRLDQAVAMSRWFLDYMVGVIQQPDVLPETTKERLARYFGEYAGVGLNILRDEILAMPTEQQFDTSLYVCGYPEQSVKRVLNGSFKEVVEGLDLLFPPLNVDTPDTTEAMESMRHLFPLILGSKTRWKAGAACSNEESPEIFFPTLDGDPSRALAVCALCNVSEECLKYALRHHIPYGVWGNMDANERRVFRRRLVVDGKLEEFVG